MSGWSYPLELVGENEWNFYMRTCIKVSVGIVWRAIGNTQELYWIHWWLPLENYYMLCGWMLRNIEGRNWFDIFQCEGRLADGHELKLILIKSVSPSGIICVIFRNTIWLECIFYFI